MKHNGSNSEPQERNRNPFTVINNVFDYCEQPHAKRLLMVLLAKYCDPDAFCYPGNKELAQKMRMSERTVQRMLKELKAEGEIELVSKGKGGRRQKRVLRLTRYVTPQGVMGVTPHEVNHDTSLSPLTTTASLGKTSLNTSTNSQRKGEGRSRKSSERLRVFVPRVRYPKTEEEMEAMLEDRGIPYTPDYDGNFFESMTANDWTTPNDGRVYDWPKMYAARLQKTSPENFYGRA